MTATVTLTLPLLREGDGLDPNDGLQSEVKLLQEKLGFSLAQIDGQFGTMTRIAVENFQASNRLLVDGMVGINTWSALLGKPVTLQSRVVLIGTWDADKIVDSIAFPNIRKHARSSVPLILQECLDSSVTIPAQVAYILATAEHESHLGEWMEELSSGVQYENRADLGNTQPGDGSLFKGRGFVQITGRFNYTDWSTRLGIDLVEQPQRAAEPLIASKILVRGMRDGTFTGSKLDHFINASAHNFHNARTIINGFDRAERIAEIAKAYLAVL